MSSVFGHDSAGVKALQLLGDLSQPFHTGTSGNDEGC